MSQDRDYLRQLIRQAQKFGVQVERTNNGHIKLTARNGMVTFTSSTPGDRRAYLNLRSRLRLLGLIDRPAKSRRKATSKHTGLSRSELPRASYGLVSGDSDPVSALPNSPAPVVKASTNGGSRVHRVLEPVVILRRLDGLTFRIRAYRVVCYSVESSTKGR